jgi:hypothetical protein
MLADDPCGFLNDAHSPDEVGRMAPSVILSVAERRIPRRRPAPRAKPLVGIRQWICGSAKVISPGSTVAALGAVPVWATAIVFDLLGMLQVDQSMTAISEYVRNGDLKR